AVGNGEPLEIDSPVVGKTVVRAPAVRRQNGKPGVDLIHARAVVGVVGSVLPDCNGRVGTGAVEALVVRAIAAVEVTRVVGEVERYRAAATAIAGDEHRSGAGRGRARGHRQGGITGVLPRLQEFDHPRSGGIDVPVES